MEAGIGTRKARCIPSSLSSLRSGRMRMAIFTRYPPKGSSSRVVTILKRVCMLAICAAGLSGVMDCINPVNGVAMQMTVNRTVPNTLNIRWMMVVRLALRLVPMEAKTAVIQVPMFCPKRTYTALSRPITPLRASACRIPTEAEEDWIRAVKAAPARMPTTGLEKVLTRLTKAGHSRRGSMAEPIISIPIKSTPKPARIFP